MKKLVIVESPAKAKTIGQYLGTDFIVKSSYGHVRDLPSSVLGIDTENNYEVKYRTIPRAKKVVAELKKALASCEELYLAPDPDREGEAIAWHLKEELKPKIPVKRISFSEITKSAVKYAAEHPREINDKLVNAQQARRILDRLVGYKLSPLLWKKVYRGLSAGRVQSVAVRLIVEREREIKAFKARTFWTIEVSIISGKNSFKASVIDEKTNVEKEFKTKEEADKAAKKIKTSGFVVKEIEVSQTSVKPKAPLITSTLQQAAANQLGFSAKKTMKIAQDLYEGIDIGGESHGLITYMRTDSYNISNEAKKDGEKHIIKSFGGAYLPDSPNVYSKKIKGAQEAHEAIRPTDFSLTPEQVKDRLSKDHYRLYSVIYTAALASMMASAVIENTVVNGEAGSYKLNARGRKIEFDGWIKAAPSTEERYVPLPELKKGSEYKIKESIEVEHITEPPARYSEASLVKELEKRGIGRPSTYAPIMSTIVDRGYVTKQANRFFPEEVAFVVIDLLIEHFANIVDYNFTAKMEEDLDDIAEGDKQLVPVIDAFYKPFAKLLSEKTDSIDKKELVEEKTDKKCPECNEPVVIKLGRFGKFYACSKYPECKYTAPVIEEKDGGEELDEKVQQELADPCPQCGGKRELKQSRFGMFIGCSNYPKCKFTKSLNIEAEAPCPNCNKPLLKKTTRRGRIFWGCSGYPSCKTAFWDEPINKKCPDCSNILLKKKSGIKCSQCDYEEGEEASKANSK